MEAIDTHNLLISKENIQPLRQGRDTSKLCVALQADTDSELQQTLERQRNDFEIRLRSSNGSDDPLSDWCDYIHWIEQSFPRQPREGKLNIVLRKCLNKFKDSDRYKNDVRFVKLCIKYAQMEESTVELLSQIHRHGIGVKCAILYIAWAEEYALKNCFKKANVIYEKGIENHADPVQLLKEAHQNFQAFLVRKMLNAKEEFTPTFLETPAPESRQPYNVLKPVSTGQTEVVSNVRIGGYVKGSPGKLKMTTAVDRNPKSNTMIKIFEDEENEPVSMEPIAKLEKIPTRKKTTKENTVKPGPWTDKHSKRVPFTVGTSSVPFQVHRDEEQCEANVRPQMVLSSVLKTHTKKDEEEFFSNIPLFYPEPEDKSKLVMYCKDQVYAGGLEFQFEELRAIEYNRRYKESLPKTPATNEIESSSEMVTACTDENDLADRMEAITIKSQSEENICQKVLPRKNEIVQNDENMVSQNIGKTKLHHRKTLCVRKDDDLLVQDKFLPEERVVLPTTDYSMDQTINTKEALSEMQQLWFSKPASPLLHINTSTINKQAGKSILKSSNPCFKLYVDESCLDNFKKQEELEGPLDLTMKSNSNSELKPPQTAQHVYEPRRALDFDIYKDDDVKANQVAQSDSENKENDIPEDYCGPVGKSMRRVTGILTPAEDIPVAPLCDEEVDDDDEDDDVEYCAALQCNTTGITENLTKAFQFPRNESTPNPVKSSRNRQDVNKSAMEFELTENNNEKVQTDKAKEGNKTEHKSSATENVALEKKSPPNKEEHGTKNLSIIVETSREYKSSSSGSSGTSSSQIRSFKNYPYTPVDIKGATSSTIVCHTEFHQKKLSLTGYEASTESTYSGIRSRISVVEKLSSTKDVGLFINHQLSDVREEIANENEPNAVDNFPAEKTQNVSFGDLDPFSDSAVEFFLKSAGFPSKKYVKDMIYKDSILNPLKVSSSIVLGDSSYDIKKVIGEGSYARVFDLINKSTGDRIIAKVQKPPCYWEFYIVKELHLRINDRTKADSFMRVETAYFFQNASVLLSKPVEYGNLLDTVNTIKQNQQFCHLVSLYFTVEMLNILNILHSCRIIHADVKPDNFLVTNRDGKPHLQLIDFGRSIDMTLLPKGTTFTRVITTEGFTTTEMQSGKPWTYQVDFFGVANCSHCLLFGEYMKVVEKNGTWNITKIIPRYWARTEWKNYFTTLLNIESCDAIPEISTLTEPFQAILSGSRELDSTLYQLSSLLRRQ